MTSVVRPGRCILTDLLEAEYKHAGQVCHSNRVIYLSHISNVLYLPIQIVVRHKPVLFKLSLTISA